jgi:hypothetical protein
MTTLTIKTSRRNWKKQDFQNEQELLEYLLAKEGKVLLYELSESDLSEEAMQDLSKLTSARNEDIVDFQG